MNRPAKILLGLGCPDCGGSCQSLTGIGATASDPNEYDTITIGGKQYSANQLVDTNLVAQGTVIGYIAANTPTGLTPFITFQSGDLIGNVYSYINPTQESAIQAGSPLLMFYTNNDPNNGRAYYVKDDSAINTQALKDAGALTVSQETTANQDAQDLANDPVGYYLKKYGLPVLLIGGGIYAAVQLGKTFIGAEISKPKPAVAGLKKRK